MNDTSLPPTIRDITVLILAGQRDGVSNPLAVAANVSHKCLVPAGGRPLIAHVLKTLIASPVVGHIMISIDRDVFEGIAEVDQLKAQNRLTIVKPALGIAESVEAAAAVSPSWPMLITTGDNILLTTDAVERMAQAFANPEVDASVGLTTKTAVQREHERGQRRFYELADEGYANCNLYALSSPKVMAATELFREGGQFAKKRKRMIRAFGVWNVMLFLLKIGDIHKMFERVSRRVGVAIKPVIFEDGALAIDVDDENTYEVAEGILIARQGG